MKEHLVHIMKYNRDANRKVMEILSKLEESDRASDRKSYYKSLMGLVEHIVGGALFFQKFIKASIPEINYLDHKYMDYKMDPGNTPSFKEFQEAIGIVDSAFIDMVGSVNEEDLNRTIYLKFPQAELDYPLGVFIISYANHATHHRGQISQILDEMGIENNYSMIAPKYE